MKSLYPIEQELSARAGNAVGFHIIGTVWHDDHDHIIVDVGVSMWGLPDDRNLTETAVVAGWFLTKQVYGLYLTKEIPADIIWSGHVVAGLCMN